MSEETSNAENTEDAKKLNQYGKNQEGILKTLEEEVQELEQELRGEAESENTETDENDENNRETESAEEQTFKKRYGDLRRHAQKQEQDFKSKINELENQISALQNKQVELPTNEEELKEFAKKYPDIYRVMESVALRQKKEVSDDVNNKLNKLQERQKELEKREAEIELKRLHPDVEEINFSEKFKDWIAVQPEAFKNTLFEQNDPKAAARVLDLFKKDTGWGQTKENKKSTNKDVEAAKSVKSSATRQPSAEEVGEYDFTEDQIIQMTAEEFEKNEGKIREAYAKNRVRPS